MYGSFMCISGLIYNLLYRSLAESLPIAIRPDTFDSPHTKTHLLLQAHFSSAPLPIADYVTDTKSVLDQALRILQVSQFLCVEVCYVHYI